MGKNEKVKNIIIQIDALIIQLVKLKKLILLYTFPFNQLYYLIFTIIYGYIIQTHAQSNILKRKSVQETRLLYIRTLKISKKPRGLRDISPT